MYMMIWYDMIYTYRGRVDIGSLSDDERWRDIGDNNDASVVNGGNDGAIAMLSLLLLRGCIVPRLPTGKSSVRPATSLEGLVGLTGVFDDDTILSVDLSTQKAANEPTRRPWAETCDGLLGWCWWRWCTIIWLLTWFACIWFGYNSMQMISLNGNKQILARVLLCSTSRSLAVPCAS